MLKKTLLLLILLFLQISCDSSIKVSGQSTQPLQTSEPSQSPLPAEPPESDPASEITQMLIQIIGSTPVQYNSTGNIRVDLTNQANTPQSVVSISNLSEPYSLGSHDCIDVAKNDSCTLTIIFAPPGAGAFSQNLNLVTTLGTQPVAITATGTTLDSLPLGDIYTGNGNWNDYIRRTNKTVSWYQQANIACDGTEAGIHSECVHGGEKKKVVLSGVTTCTDLSATDNLGVFNWTCEVIGGDATMVSQGLKDGKGLNDLVDFTANEFLNNSVTIIKKLNGSNYIAANTLLMKWHSNTISDIILDTGSTVNLTTAGTIYTVDSPGSGTSSLSITGVNKVSVLIKKGVELKDSLGASALVLFSNARFGWLEGSFDGDDVTHEMLKVYNSKFIKVYNVNARNTISATLEISGAASSGNLIYNFKGLEDGASDEIIWLTNGSHDNVYKKLHLVGAQAYGSFLIWGGAGINNNTISDVIISGSFTTALKAAGGAECNMNTFSHFTIINGSNYAVNMNGCDNSTFNNFLLSNNTQNISVAGTSSNGIWSNIAIANSGGVAINLTSTTGHKFTNNLLIGNNSVSGCNVGGAGVGLDANCDQESTSNHSLITGLDTSASFVGQLSVDDLTNQEASSSVVFSSLVDLYDFDNWFRFWGTSGGNFPDVSQRGNCSGGATCQIWDVSLNQSDTEILNRTNDGQTSNEVFTPANTCPSAVDGSKVLTDQQTTPNTFLVNAKEIMSDSLGDDDGLCESNEACLYSPNFGAYQGNGDYKTNGTCSFSNGTVQDVLMYAYPDNGA